jgi:hypothetical protein
VNDSMDLDDELESAGDRRLGALLRSVHAPANPAVWQRVRTRLAAAEAPARVRGLDAVLAWFTRPAALAAASAALVVALGTGWSLRDALAPAADAEVEFVATESASLIESLLDPAAATAAGLEDGGDGGETDGAAPGDSGGPS